MPLDNYPPDSSKARAKALPLSCLIQPTIRSPASLKLTSFTPTLLHKLPHSHTQHNPPLPTSPQDTTQTTTTPPPVTPDFPQTQLQQFTALPPRPQQSYTYMRSANCCISPPRPVNLFPSTSPTTSSHQCDPNQLYNIHIPLQGHATLTAVGPPTAAPHIYQPSLNTPNFYYMPPQANIRPNHPEATTGPEGPWWDAEGSAP